MTPCFAVAMTFLASSRLGPRLGSSIGSASSPKHGNIGNAHDKGRFGNESRYSVASAVVGLGLGAAALSSSRRARGTACRRARGGASATFDATKEIGVCAPLGASGEYIWDPLGFTTDAATFRKYRQAEIKHGRAAMMGTLGLIFSGAAGMGFKNDFEVLTAKNPGEVQPGGLLGVLVILIGFIELTWSDEDRAPGDFGDPFGWNISKDDITKPDAQPWEISVPVLSDTGKNLETGSLTIIEGTSTALALKTSTPDVEKNLLPLSTYQDYEINHGRLAMFGFIGAIAAEYNTGHDVFWQWENASMAARDFVKLTQQ